MEKVIFLPNYRGGLQIPPKMMEEVFGATKTFLFIFFENFFILAAFDETKALADQTKAFEERFKDDLLKGFQINTLHGAQFKMGPAQLTKYAQNSIDIFIGFSDVMTTDERKIPYFAIQPANTTDITCSSFQRVFIQQDENPEEGLHNSEQYGANHPPQESQAE